MGVFFYCGRHEILDENENVDRKKLKEIVFENKDKLKKFKPFKAMAEDTDYYDRVKTKKVSLIKWIFQALSCKCLYITNLRDMKPVYSKIDNIIKNKIKK